MVLMAQHRDFSHALVVVLALAAPSVRVLVLAAAGEAAVGTVDEVAVAVRGELVLVMGPIAASVERDS